MSITTDLKSSVDIQERDAQKSVCLSALGPLGVQRDQRVPHN